MLISRRKVFSMISALPFVKSTLQAQPVGVNTFVWHPASELKPAPIIVEYLQHGVGENNESVYMPLKEFETEEEAIAWVRDLIPEVIYIVAHKHNGDGFIRSGYRGAIRMIVQDSIRQTTFAIVSRTTGNIVQASDWPMWDANRAWAVLENIRVNGKPVSRPNKSGNLSEYMTMPFQKGNPVIEYV